MAKAKQTKSPNTQDVVKNALLGMTASTSSLRDEVPVEAPQIHSEPVSQEKVPHKSGKLSKSPQTPSHEPSLPEDCDSLTWIEESVNYVIDQKRGAQGSDWESTASQLKPIPIRVPKDMYRRIMIHKLDSNHSANTMFLVGVALYLLNADEIDALIKEMEERTGVCVDRFQRRG